MDRPTITFGFVAKPAFSSGRWDGTNHTATANNHPLQPAWVRRWCAFNGSSISVAERCL